MQQTTYSVPGISCEHCRSAITGELEHVDGIQAIDVDVAAKRVTITGSGFDAGAVIAAIDEAGYEVADERRDAPEMVVVMPARRDEYS